MLKSFFSFLILSYLLIACSPAEIQPSQIVVCPLPDYSSHPKHFDLINLMEEYHNKGLPGISVLIKDDNGKWVGTSGYASLENKIPITACTPVKVASLTKMFLGATTMSLLENPNISSEEFNLDMEISEFIDSDILQRIDISGGNTVRNLLNHTTGIYDVITDSEFYLAVLNQPNKTWSQEELLEYVYDKPAVELNDPYPASYSNTNTLLLSMVIEAVTGEDHFKALQSELIQPLFLTNTYYQGKEEVPNIAAQGYFDLHNNEELTNVSNFITGSGNGYNGIYSDLYDLEKLINGLFINQSIVSGSVLQDMMTFVQEDEDYFTGLGLVQKFTELIEPGVGHTGRELGYTADAFYFPESGRTMIFLINYGTDAESFLKPVFEEFELELAKLVLE